MIPHVSFLYLSTNRLQLLLLLGSSGQCHGGCGPASISLILWFCLQLFYMSVWKQREGTVDSTNQFVIAATAFSIPTNNAQGCQILHDLPTLAVSVVTLLIGCEAMS